MLRRVGRFFAKVFNGLGVDRELPVMAASELIEPTTGTLKLSLFGHFLSPTEARAEALMPATHAELPAVDTANSAAAPLVRPSLFAARLRCVSKLNRNASRLRSGLPLNAKRSSAKRAPALYPVKCKKLVSKRAKTKIITHRPKLKTAVILRFPQRITKAQPQRQKPAA